MRSGKRPSFSDYRRFHQLIILISHIELLFDNFRNFPYHALVKKIADKITLSRN